MDNGKNWYPKYPSIHVSKENGYPCIHVSMISKYPWYPNIQLSKYPKKIGIQDIHVSGYMKKVVSVHPYFWFYRLSCNNSVSWLTLTLTFFLLPGLRSRLESRSTYSQKGMQARSWRPKMARLRQIQSNAENFSNFWEENGSREHFSQTATCSRH